MSEKHLVCQGAVCRCDFGTTTDKLMVKTQSKRYINDKDGKEKLMATHVDIGATFENNSFGSCKKLNNGPCAPVVTKWEGFYDQIIVQDNNGKALLEDSKATCAVSNTSSIKITFHGQTAEPTQQNVNNARPEVLAQLVPLKEDNKEYVYYTKDGAYLGGLENSTKVYLSSQEDYDKAKEGKKWSAINVESNLLKEKNKPISNTKLISLSATCYGECSLEYNLDVKNELYAIAYVHFHHPENVAYGSDSAGAKAFKSKKAIERNNKTMQTAIGASINAFTNGNDFSNGADSWDGVDVLTGGSWNNWKQESHFRQRANGKYKGISDPQSMSPTFYASVKKALEDKIASPKVSANLKKDYQAKLNHLKKLIIYEENKNFKPLFQVVATYAASIFYKTLK